MHHKYKHKNNLVLYRERVGFSQQHVMLLLGSRDMGMLSRIEQGRRLPTLKTALKLAIIYRVPVDFLYAALYEQFREVIRRREAAMSAPRQQALPL